MDGKSAGVIEKGIPIPASSYRGGLGTILVGLDIGDSVRVDYARRRSVSGMIQYHQKTRGPGEQFVRRTMLDENGRKYVRIWRTA